ncbi:MAG TPA: hypothetical protein VMU77_04860 [Acidimicrobiales bacterium]|nr:hypothetical protein [Acidimicrobiales bacterium]
MSRKIEAALISPLVLDIDFANNCLTFALVDRSSAGAISIDLSLAQIGLLDQFP